MTARPTPVAADQWGAQLNAWLASHETHHRTPGATVTTQKTLAVQTYVDHATAVTTNAWGLHVGAVSGVGTVGTAYGAQIDSPTLGTTKWALYVLGTAPSFFGGHVETDHKNINAKNGTVFGKSIVAGVSGSTPQGQLTVYPDSAGAFGAVFQAASGQTADLLRFLENSGVPRLRVDKDGTVIIGVNGAPADAQLAANEMALWFDPTNGASKLMIKAKQSDGTVKTGSVALA